MNNTKANLIGCFFLIIVMAVLVATIVSGGAYAIGRATDWHTSDNMVAIAKLQAQDHLTVACMQNSWFTSMRDCIDAGGVNGALGVSWSTLIMFCTISVAVSF